ncbi:MAG: 50S ribosomal protein L5 [Gemmatimonadales bacterium]|nr:50S ribosomal protein L5 [Gemmatimonadales bacterium]
MAETKDTGKDGKGGKGGKGGTATAPKGGAPSGSSGKSKDKAPAGAVDHAPKAAEGKPRLQDYYEKTVRPKLAKEFGLSNPNQVPRVVKIVLNVGMGDAGKNPKQLDAAVEELGLITGQRAMVTRAKKAIANFGLRAGMPVGAAVTLRGARMYEFLDRFINLAIPRIRDFRGLPTRSFDGRGNYTFGIKEQMIFPEIDYDRVEKIHGMDITLVSSTSRDDLAMGLLRELGWPFRGETPQRVA